MKKIMILMLSLAVLFSFAACDNSSNTPSDDEATVGLSDSQIATVASTVKGLLDGTGSAYDGTTAYTTVALDAIIAKDAELLDSAKEYAPITGVTVSGDYTTITKTVNLEDGVDGFTPDTVVTLTLNGVDTTPSVTASGNKLINVETYTYEFATAAEDASGNVVTLSGDVSGYVVGGVFTVVLDAEGDATSIKLTTALTDQLLPATDTDISAMLGEADVDAAKLYAILTSKAGIPADMKTYDAYRASLISEGATCYKNAVNTFAGTLTASSESVFSTLATLVTSKPAGFSGVYSGSSTSGSATFTYTVPAEAEAVSISGADTGEELRLAAGDTLKVTLASAPNTDAVNSFTAATFEITGTLQAYDTDAVNADFKEIEVAITGELASGVTVTNSNNSVGSLTASAVTASKLAGSASAEIAVGPALIQSGDNVGTPVVETVTVEYPYTPAV